MPPDSQSIFDLDETLARLGGDRRLLEEVAGIFVADSPAMLEAIESAIAACDPAAVFRATHRLKGSAANFTSRPAVAAALGLEALAATGTLEGSEIAFAELEGEVRRLRAALAAFVAESARARGAPRTARDPEGVAPEPDVRG